MPDPSTQRQTVAQAIRRGLDFLAADQRPSGELTVNLSNTPSLASGGSDSCNFLTGMFLYAARFLADPRLPEMQQKARQFLLGERVSPDLWRYWTQASGKATPPDLDDTALISFALMDSEPTVRASGNRQIVSANRSSDGLFMTWIKPDGGSNDVDSVVNANVLLYLGDTPETAACATFLNESIRTDSEASTYWYYLDDIALHYAVSRASHHGVRSLDSVSETVAEKARAKLESLATEDSLNASLAISTLINLGRSLDDARSLTALDLLLESQRSDGSWRRQAYYTGPEPPAPHSAWFGSEALTTCLCLEALARWRDQP